MATYRILSLDGGGIRGVYTARILDRLTKKIPNLLDEIDLFAGTSTGGIIALGLAAGLSPAELVHLYASRGKEIFDATLFNKMQHFFGLSGADYGNTKLRQILRSTFGDKKLADLDPRRVLIPAFDLDNEDEPRSWKPKFFHNYPGEDSDGDELIVDVAIRTSAAPTYFPSYDGYIDGGVVANNPSVAALAQALDCGQNLTDIRLLSIGTGLSPTYIPGKSHDWGIAQWARPLTNLMIDGVMGVADFQCKRILRTNYRRICTVLPAVTKMDDVKSCPRLIAAADQVDLEPILCWLRDFC